MCRKPLTCCTRMNASTVCFDNDKAGYEATRAIELEYPYRVRDFSHNYRGYSDLNDYLCGRKQEQKNAASQVQETKQETGQRAAPRQKRGRGI